MAVREAIQKNKIAGIVTAVFLFVLAGAIMAYTLWPSGLHMSANGSFYSDDDGKTYFSDTIFNFPPFDHDGKSAYRAMVYSSKSGNFVGFLARYTPEVKKKLEDSYAKTTNGDQPMYVFKQFIGSPEVKAGTEYKLPGDTTWSYGMPRVKAPDGGDCMMVMP